HALEKNSALNNSQKVSLDLNNLQVISQETQELLGLVVRHVRLKNIPITFSGSSQLDPGILLTISEGRPQFSEVQKQVQNPFTIKPKYFSRFSKPFFSSENNTEFNKRKNADSVSEQINDENGLNIDFEEDQMNNDDLGQNVFSAKYSHWLVFSWILFASLICLTIVLMFMLQPENETGTVVKEFITSEKVSSATKKEITEKQKKTSSGNSLIHEVIKGNITEVQRLLNADTNLELKDQNGYTPLMHAVKQQNPLMVEMLAIFGANVNISDNIEDTPLVWASSMNNSEIVKILLEKGADPDKGNFTPVMWSAFHGNVQMLKLFLEYRANLNSRTHEGWTALMWTAEKGNILAMWELLRRGARVNMQNNTGQTALMFASRSGNIATLGLLLKKGGDSSIVDFDKETALDYAKIFQHKDAIRLLEKEF
ncbi:MAG: ankyrin repeat domain-containing protein, partial [SAR324 cluster bacterium]|nr:ankyrin repeat domain-containing protein [SAR324 cluster bacterium]